MPPPGSQQGLQGYPFVPLGGCEAEVHCLAVLSTCSDTSPPADHGLTSGCAAAEGVPEAGKGFPYL